VTLHRRNGDTDRFAALAEIETTLEIDTLKAGGMIALLLHRTLSRHRGEAHFAEA
jgi:aconitase A